MKRYLLTWLAATTLVLLLVGVFNLVVDPYGVFRVVDKPGFNTIKPAAGSHGAMAKAYQVLAVQPQSLVLGNSRSEVGLDPNHPAWPAHARPVFNLALPGTGTGTSLQYLQHVINAAGNNPAAMPKVVVWGIDMMDFLVDPQAPTRSAPASPNHRLLTSPASTTNPQRLKQQARDYAESLLTLGALLDSAQTLASQRNPYPVNLTPQGFNPMRDYLKITAVEGYWNVFRQKDQANITSFLRRPKSIFDASGVTSGPLEDLRAVLRLCRQHGIQLNLYTYPYHAHLLEIFRITGHWPALAVWKTTVVNIVEDEAKAAGQAAYPVWDFSAFNAYTTEAVPAQGDRKTTMQWYWEAGHFKSELGSLILDRVLGQKDTPTDFGLRINTANLAAQNMSVNKQAAQYRATYPQEVAELERFAMTQQARQK
jgi:hypothetical protein